MDKKIESTTSIEEIMKRIFDVSKQEYSILDSGLSNGISLANQKEFIKHQVNGVIKFILSLALHFSSKKTLDAATPKEDMAPRQKIEATS
ncbi:MAG TPA: hypothetical protein VMZ91_00030 [Candidatus Paceibacterota bacterium]|nr:hypothetical protein [Candidatus Paceibacterota bacterium]